MKQKVKIPVLPGELSLRILWPPITAGLITFGLLQFAFPPHEAPETAYVFLVPALWWLSFRPSYRSVLGTFLFFGWLYHLTLLWWLRHVTFPGLALGSLLLSAYLSIWFLLARWMVPRALAGGFGMRLNGIFTLSAAWTSMEWARCQFTLGFPWCPLSVSQWKRPAILQAAEWTGGWAVSFFLVFFNLCVASYLHHLLVRRFKSKGSGIVGSMCPDFYLGLLLLALMVSPFFLSRPNPKDHEPLLRAGFVQPYLLEKWQTGRAARHKEVLRRLTLMTAASKPEAILWPEASTPYAITEDNAWVTALSRETNIPMLIGAVAKSPEKDHSYNTVCRLTPKEGLDLKFYAKRMLVPFGEYVPTGFGWIPNLDKLVGPTGKFTAGGDARTLSLDLNSTAQTLNVGPLVCYEDIFPNLARQHVREGADFLFVSTNNAWFGEEGCAEQHAAHSVLRAIENRRPVIRCGNAGWSGWIDESGNRRSIMLDENRSVYFEGAATFSITRDSKLANKPTFFTHHGDWFAYACIALQICGILVARQSTKDSPRNEVTTIDPYS